MDFKKSYDEYVVKAKVLFPDATFWSWEKLPEDIKRAWRKLYPAPPSEMKPLSADAQTRMTKMIEEVLEPAMKAQAKRNPDDFVYEAPEVWMQQVMNVGARIVNRALTIAFKDWGLNEESCAWCLQYEHGMRPSPRATCTCQRSCGAMVCLR